jgi:hypothetical protein
MRRVFAVAALLLAASCGGSMSPTASTPIPALPSGAYALSVTVGGTATIGGFTFSACVSGPGPVQYTDPPPTNVELQHTGNTVTIQPDDSTATFRMDLQMSGATLSGTASGQFGRAGTLVIVGGMNGEPAAAVGTASGSGAAGNLTGNVSASGMGCNAGNWSVTPR